MEKIIVQKYLKGGTRISQFHHPGNRVESDYFQKAVRCIPILILDQNSVNKSHFRSSKIMLCIQYVMLIILFQNENNKAIGDYIGVDIQAVGNLLIYD